MNTTLALLFLLFITLSACSDDESFHPANAAGSEAPSANNPETAAENLVLPEPTHGDGLIVRLFRPTETRFCWTEKFPKYHYSVAKLPISSFPPEGEQRKVEDLDFPSFYYQFEVRGAIGARFCGYLTVPEEGIYEFKIEADNSAALYLNNQAMFLTQVGAFTFLTNVRYLAQGAHSFTLDFYDAGVAAAIRVFWRKAGESYWSPIPPQAFHGQGRRFGWESPWCKSPPVGTDNGITGC